MIIEWKAGVYAHNQTYYDLGLTLNWPGTASPFIAYDELLGGDVIFTEWFAKRVVMTEEQIKDVVLTESVSKEVVH